MGVLSESLLGVCLCLCMIGALGKLNGKDTKFTNIWVAKIEGGEEVAQRIARDLGYTYKGQFGQLRNHYEMIREDHPQVSLRDSHHLTRDLLDYDEVKWAKQQMLLKPVIHGGSLYQFTRENQQKQLMQFLRQEAENQAHQSIYSDCPNFFSCITYYPYSISSYLRGVGQPDISRLGTFSTTPAPMKQLSYSYTQTQSVQLLSSKVSAYALKYDDPFWIKQWNMQDYRTTPMPVMDLNVIPVHGMGYTGKGIMIGVVDNGVEHKNNDFENNFVSRLSYDMCKDQKGSHPTGHPHGTNCAGVIAMNPNNDFCGVGIAYGVKIVGLRAICDNEVAPSATAKALVHGLDEIDIYTNSWGLTGEGKYIFSRDHLDDEAYYQGITMGRDGKGVIYVRSSGNDRDVGDNCAVDPNINSPYAITIAGAEQLGKPAYYSERCTAVFATTYTLGSSGTEGIVAPNLNGGCRDDFSGTSAACPQASAVIALVLQANPKLTYRDVMHLITMSAEVAPLADNENSWYRNGRGFWVSNDFGFGLMNAENMVRLALGWKNVPEKHECVLSATFDPVKFAPNQDAIIQFKTPACKGSPENEIIYLEHIELSSVAEYNGNRGDIMVFITSPAGTTSQLLETRYLDDDPDGLEGFTITSTHNWGERPQGEWTLVYSVNEYNVPPGHVGYVHGFTIKFHGTKERPAHYTQRRKYAAFRLPNGRTC